MYGLRLARRVAWFAAAALAFLSAARPQTSAAKSDATPRDVSELLLPIREKHDVPALAAALVEGGELTAIGADGVRERGTDEKVTATDRFHLGSCTKAMTATLLATFVEEEKLRWSTTVGEVFADVEMKPAWKSVTVEQLLTHTGGAPADLSADGLWGRLWKMEGSPSEQRMTLVRGVLGRDPEPQPGTKFVYSNAGFALAGAMAEKLSGKAWEDAMRERIFGPLHMDSAGFGAPGTPGASRGRAASREPLGHRQNGDPVQVGPGADNPPAIGPAGTAHCTLSDWGSYAALHLAGARAERGLAQPGERGPAILKTAAFARMHAPSEVSGGKYAMGWGVGPRAWAKGPVLGHAGSNTMWYCTVSIAPEENLAVLVAVNQGGDAAAKACKAAEEALVAEHVRARDAAAPGQR